MKFHVNTIAQALWDVVMKNAAVVIKKWANSGLRDVALDPNVTEGAVAAVVDGTVYTTGHTVTNNSIFEIDYFLNKI